MPFGRLHEEAAGESKLLVLSDAAWRMWGMGLIYCQKNLTDGFIDGQAISSWGIKAPNKLKVAQELCREQVKGRAPLWSRADGGYQVHDYLQWNDSKADILLMRAKAKHRLDRFRERRASDGAQNGAENGDRNGAGNAFHNAFEDAIPVVRGSVEDQKQGDPRNPPSAVGRSAGVLGGALPRDHIKHAACDETYSRCVPLAVHEKLSNLLAPKHHGDRREAGDALRAWYPTVWASLPADFVMPDAFKFWQARFDASLASTDETPKAGAVASTVPNAARTSAYLKQQREG